MFVSCCSCKAFSFDWNYRESEFIFSFERWGDFFGVSEKSLTALIGDTFTLFSIGYWLAVFIAFVKSITRDEAKAYFLVWEAMDKACESLAIFIEFLRKPAFDKVKNDELILSR